MLTCFLPLPAGAVNSVLIPSVCRTVSTLPTDRKNRGLPEVVCRDFFNSFMPKRLWQIAGFNFGFWVENWELKIGNLLLTTP
jgi:hypothetical protein